MILIAEFHIDMGQPSQPKMRTQVSLLEGLLIVLIIQGLDKREHEYVGHFTR
jgi:hypothetical protein